MKNKLLYYQGGGYAGCIWEWNFCFWDADGVWHNLYASGCDGAETEQQAFEVIGCTSNKFKAELVDLTNAERFKQFQQDNHAGLVLNIAKELNENYNYALELICDVCGNFTPDHSGNDTAIDNSTIICYECLAVGTCDCCNEYVGDTELTCCDENGIKATGLNSNYDFYYDDETAEKLADLGYYVVCNDCFEYNKEEFERAKLEDVRFQAFCTGEPDIFSEALREYWS